MDKKQKKQLKQFATISLAEGVSFMVLLLIAMPLKYLADLPQMVKYVGWAHGVLFMAYLFQLLYVTIEMKWKFQRLVTYFIAAFLPLAPFFVERQVKRMIQE